MVQEESIREEEVAVCCSCFGRASPPKTSSSTSKPKSESRSLPDASAKRNGTAMLTTKTTTTTTNDDPRANFQGRSSRRMSVYFEAQDGIIEEASLEFFDAVEELDDNDNADNGSDAYPIITRAMAPSKSFRVSILEPDTMLRVDNDDEAEEPMENFHQSFARRGSVEVGNDLRQPQVAVRERGYPGLLDEKELEQCQTFYREVTRRKGAIRDIVFAYKDIEEEPYTICRFLRPTKFSAAEMLTRLEDNKELWEKSAAADFYPDLEKAMGIPTSLFKRFYPFFYSGFAKNGCPVNYFKAGKIHVEGLLSMVTMEQVSYNAWNICKYVFPGMVVKAQERDRNFVRCESVNVIDLEGLSSSQASSEAMEIVKQATKVGNFFPETMHCMLVRVIRVDGHMVSLPRNNSLIPFCVLDSERSYMVYIDMENSALLS